MNTSDTMTNAATGSFAFLRDPAAPTLACHFVGIGGCGMSGLAQVLLRAGHRVSGSDAADSPVTRRLASLGIPVHPGHAPDALPHNAVLVVASAAVAADNPELVEARRRNLPVLKYAQMLGRISAGFQTLAVAGTHGKSTTSAWLAYALDLAGTNPNFVIGADIPQLHGSSGAGQGQHLVVEACEYDRSFLNLRPHAAAILNLEADHLDYYRDLDEIVEAFRQFVARVRPDGLALANAADPHALAALHDAPCPTETFALDAPAHWTAANLTFVAGHAHFELLHAGASLGPVSLSLPGRHNLANALAVAALAHHAGLAPDEIRHALETFAGVGRRLTLKGAPQGITILDDYAHHPTEIRATLAALRAKYAPKRLWCVFQPHQASRTALLLEDFAGSFADADVTLLADIYSVRDSEADRQKISARDLAQRSQDRGHDVRYLGDFARIMDTLCLQLSPGDLVVTMGAGNVGSVADELLCRLGTDR